MVRTIATLARRATVVKAVIDEVSTTESGGMHSAILPADGSPPLVCAARDLLSATIREFFPTRAIQDARTAHCQNNRASFL